MNGLTQKEAERKLAEYGPNTIREKKPGLFLKILHFAVSPISLMLLAAATLSYYSGKIFDFYFILFLMLLNFSISFWHEWKADQTIEKLKQTLRVMVKVLRDGSWQKIESSTLVPGDIVQLGLGDLVPADVKVIEGENLSLNEAVLTGESLPKEKKAGDLLYSGSYIITGKLTGSIEKTGSQTFFGKTLMSVETRVGASLLEKDIVSIAKFLSLVSLGAVGILTVIFVTTKVPLVDILTLDLSLVIAGVPISLPTVMTLIISLGTLELAKKNVIVRRISSLEDLSNVNLLFTDKTGTLTENNVKVAKIITYKEKEDNLIFYAYLTGVNDNPNPINTAIIDKAKEEKVINRPFEVKNFIPADSERKRSTINVLLDGKLEVITLGAWNVIEKLTKLAPVNKKRVEKDVSEAANLGYRVLALAVKSSPNPKEKNMDLLGLFFLSDSLRPEAKDVVSFLGENGIHVKMLTGDHRAIANRVGEELGIAQADIYSEIYPDEKYRLVTTAAKSCVSAVTGDGVNDIPAVAAAQVGIAVSNAVDALKSTADIVLLSAGISVIKDAIVEARKIFVRLYAYSVYRISESFRVIINIAILGLLYKSFPLTPIQLILLALLNDIPIISLAFNRVELDNKPASINPGQRLFLATMFGIVGTVNSLLYFFLLKNGLHLSWDIIQTGFFLKLAVGGHLLIYVAHTKRRWWNFLPSKSVITATAATQAVATVLALFGVFMPSMPILWVIFTWGWAILWMQVTEATKEIKNRLLET